MKLRVLFLKKVHIFYFILAVLSLLFLILFLNYDKKTDVFAIVDEKTIIKSDLNGDGKEEILYINNENDKYYLQISSDNKSYTLVPDDKLATMGQYYPYFPMKINLIDVNRDKIPEIFVQSMEKGQCIQHIFYWNGSEFIDSFCSSNNIIGVIDSKSNRTPKIVSGNYNNNSISLAYYMHLNGNVEKITASDDLPGKEAVSGFINYIHSLPGGEAYKPNNVFSPNISVKDLNIISKMAVENKIYKFTDAYFVDTKFNSNGIASEYKWIINFKASPISASSNSERKSIILYLRKTTEANNPFKIASIEEKK
ncbi:MAG: VCBS repeat-containing protein [Clostridiales bacterium]|uniref:FG-GAP repeat domain-containing protein n=1 Tax=Clostridium sp. N3C TaxID=1776758 RepID=UPI00092E0FF0|nr:VCBS repeat-containing protein [Clostridium sp. N3C]NLZ49237.1 VCBS repeat-containing protein [Clostridiales bacterium]SCN24775.1 hypothetical protein N3C_1972 [Clostridium sp. N3C]